MMRAVESKQAPAAIGPYSQVIASGNTVYFSGQIPLNPATMQLCSEDIALQISQVFENLANLAVAAEGSLANIIKLSIYLIDLQHFSLINTTMLRYFTAPYPARMILGVSALPCGAQVAIDAVMEIPPGVTENPNLIVKKTV